MSDFDSGLIAMACVFTGLIGGMLIAMALSTSGMTDKKAFRWAAVWAAFWLIPSMSKLWLAAALG